MPLIQIKSEIEIENSGSNLIRINTSKALMLQSYLKKSEARDGQTNEGLRWFDNLVSGRWRISMASLPTSRPAG
jgi:hypothetical protein